MAKQWIISQLLCLWITFGKFNEISHIFCVNGSQCVLCSELIVGRSWSGGLTDARRTEFNSFRVFNFFFRKPHCRLAYVMAFVIRVDQSRLAIIPGNSRLTALLAAQIPRPQIGWGVDFDKVFFVSLLFFVWQITGLVNLPHESSFQFRFQRNPHRNILLESVWLFLKFYSLFGTFEILYFVFFLLKILLRAFYAARNVAQSSIEKRDSKMFRTQLLQQVDWGGKLDQRSTRSGPIPKTE